MSLLWVFCFLVLERLFEVLLSRKHTQIMIDRGALEHYAHSYPSIVLLHVFFLISLFLESYQWNVPWDGTTWSGLLLIVALQAWRYWCVASLGEFWNTRIIVLAGSTLRQAGPYRFLRHPNYLGVTLEFLILPVLMRAPLTFLLFFPLNLLVLWRRVSLEETALKGLAGERRAPR